MNFFRVFIFIGLKGICVLIVRCVVIVVLVELRVLGKGGVSWMFCVL